MTEPRRDVEDARSTRATAIARALREGAFVSDAAFDRLLPERWRSVSDHYWTPVEVAQRAARWIEQESIETVLDLGSGVGKFCVASALTSRARFIGVEQRHALVEVARSLAAQLFVSDRVRFVHGAIADVKLPDAELYYLFNPFEENFYEPEESLDASVELSAERFTGDVEFVQRLLRDAPVGTRLLTYNGLGGAIPNGYVETRLDRELPCVLRMWTKTGPSTGIPRGGVFRPSLR